jgi:hypothetical protein
MRLRLLGVLFLVVGLGCLCSRGDDETGDTGPGIDTNLDTGIPGGPFWEEYATALCEHYQRCDPEFFESAYDTMEHCIEVFTTDLSAGAVAYEGCVFVESNGTACIHGIEAGPCEGFELPPACQGLFYCDE